MAKKANREPLVKTASVTAAVTAVLTLLVSFGVPLTDGQQQAIVSVAAIAAPFVVAWLGRKHVFPVDAIAEADFSRPPNKG